MSALNPGAICGAGSAATILHPITPAIREEATAGEAGTAGEAATAAAVVTVVVIDADLARKRSLF